MSHSNKLKVMVLGASGMAGHMVTYYLRENGFTVDTLAATQPLDKKTHLLDVTNAKRLENLLTSTKYDAVINCIGVLVKQSEQRKDLAVYINSYLPHFLENLYKASDTKVVHISTDDVFSYATPPYYEDSAYDGRSFYGRTKALGEITNDKDATFRMSIIGPDVKAEGQGLFNWFFKQTGEVQGFTKAIWNGITTLELARAIRAAIEQDLSGIYHLVPGSSISKFELLELIKKEFKRKNVILKPAQGTAADKTLSNTRKDFNYVVPNYETMIKDMRVWIEDHPDLYKHYE